MPYVPPPLDPELLARLPPEAKRKLIEQEKRFLAREARYCGQMIGGWWPIAFVLTAYLVFVLSMCVWRAL